MAAEKSLVKSSSPEIIITSCAGKGIRLEVISDALKEVQERGEELGPMACDAVKEAVLICTNFASGAYDDQEENPYIFTEKLLQEQALLIKQNRGALITSLHRISKYKKVLSGGGVISSLSSYVAYTSWLKFSKAISTLLAVGTGSMNGVLSILAALNDVKMLIPEDASWADYIKFVLFSKRPIIGDTTELANSIIDKFTLDPTSILYQTPDIGQLEPAPSVETGFIGNIGSILSGIAESTASLAKESLLKATGLDHDIKVVKNKLEYQRELFRLDIHHATRQIQTSMDTIYDARDLIRSLLIPLTVMILLLVIYVVYRTCINEYLYARTRREQKRVAETIKRTVSALQSFMSSTTEEDEGEDELLSRFKNLRLKHDDEKHQD